MAEQLLIGTVERISQTLVSLDANEMGQLRGVKDEFVRVMNTVSIIQDVLLDAVEKQAGNHAVRDWLGKLSDAIYDADDLVDAISAEDLRREIMTRDKKAKQVRIFFSTSNQFAFRLRMSREIKAIRRRFDAIDAERQRFHLKVRHVETRVRGNSEWNDTHSFVPAEAVIGREDDKKAVIHRLLDSNVEENVSILPIVGIGGIGKTTLAQHIFNDEQIQKYFGPKMWVRVSDPFHVKNIVEKILEAATKTKPETVDMETLAGKLKEKIDGKRYFLVLDDVWNEDHEKWSNLIEVLMGGARGSSILVTTRAKKVAMISGTVQPYLLGGLEIDASWSLFKRNAFQRGEEPENSSIVKLGRDILEKCAGVPLIIRTIGSLLCSKNPETEWLPFKNKELSKMFETEKSIVPSLKLSYDQLPSHLKHCFAYCCLFPKYYETNKSTLIQLWIAQGFVKLSNQNRCLESVGNEYFMDLLGRSFFQEAEMDEFGNVMRYKMHDLMHDLAILMGGSLFATLDNNATNVDEKTRHVSFGCDINSSVVQTVLKKASMIRTFLYLGGDHFEAEINCDEIFKSFKFLRVLDMHKRNIDIVPSSIGKLKHLRYLDLSRNCDIKKLPDSITRLQNLETLKLSKCRSLKELPRGIKRLVNLRHLEVDGCYGLTYMPRGLGQLINLRTLSRFVIHLDSHSRHSGGLRELNELNNLRGELVIENLEHGNGVVSECKAANLKEKQHLHALHLWWSSQTYANDSDVEDEASLECLQPHQNLKHLRLGQYQGSRLPRWLLSLTNLVRFELYWCKKCQYLPPLSQLPSLKHLLLISLDAMEYISDSDSNEFSSSSASMPFFPSLNEISLWGCRNLKGWWRGDSFVEGNNDSHNSVEITEHHLVPCFPRLSKLAIQYCPKLTSMPMFPHLEEELVLVDASSKPLQQTMMMNMAAMQSPTATATASSSVTPLSKLKSIQLDSIPDLETLPEGIRWLTSLQRLTIVECPILLQRCKRDTGEDWAKIAHIPDLNLRYWRLQE